MKKLTNQQFLKRCQAVWGSKYDLSRVNYTGMRNKIIVGCTSHGEFEVTATNFTVNQSGCPVCGAQNAKSTGEFIRESKEKHGDKYDYRYVIYVNARSKVKIKCREHGVFEQLPNTHISGSGCPKCSKVAKLTPIDFITQSKQVHGDKYCYKKTHYKRAIDPVTITCEEHGDFEQLPHNHLAGRGCRQCGKDKFLKKMKMSLVEARTLCVRSRIELIDYPGNATDKATLRCAKNHIWFSSISKIRQGGGCPICSIPGYNPNKTGYVYMLVSHDGKYMKVGLSNSPKKRIRTLKMYTPFDFVVRGWTAYEGYQAPKVETAFHRKCQPAQLIGFDGCTEWFIYDSSIADIFDLQGLP